MYVETISGYKRDLWKKLSTVKSIYKKQKKNKILRPNRFFVQNQKYNMYTLFIT